MAKAQGKKAKNASGKGAAKAAKKAAAKVKKAAKAVKKKVAPKKKPAPPKKVKAKPAPAKKAAPKKKPVKSAKPIKKAAAKAKKAVKKVVAKVVAAKPAAAAKPAVAAKPPAAAPKPVSAKPTPLTIKPKAVKPAAPPAPVAPKVPPAPKPAPAESEKKRGRRARPRVHSNGAPAASWLSTEKPRSASFIAAPARAEAPSAIAAPPASSDRLIREEDLAHPAVRTVPVRIDVEQGAGRFYVIANPMEVTLKAGEGIEWDFRYIGGADVTVDEIVVEFDKPSPFTQSVFKTRKPGGARPHRQLSGGASQASVGKRLQYTVRAMNPFKTELANTKIWVAITS